MPNVDQNNRVIDVGSLAPRRSAPSQFALSQSLLNPGETAPVTDGIQDFANIQLSDPTPAAPQNEVTGFDLGKLKLSQPVDSSFVSDEGSDFGVTNEQGGRQTLTPGQIVAAQAVSSGISLAGGLQNIKSQEREALSKLNRSYARNQVVQRLAKVDRDTTITRRALQSIRAIGKQAGAPQTGESQHQQFFSSPTSGRDL